MSFDSRVVVADSGRGVSAAALKTQSSQENSVD